jgi:hypothetical protein
MARRLLRELTGLLAHVGRAWRGGDVILATEPIVESARYARARLIRA